MKAELASRQEGQAVVEFAMIGLVFMMLTVGLIDVGRAFWTYNVVASAARFGARWGAVQGGSCASVLYESSSDWCNALGTTTNYFWGQSGNYPLSSTGTCPSTYSAGDSRLYRLDASVADTTIVGAIKNHLDTSSGSSSSKLGAWSAGLEATRTYVCIQLPTSNNEYDSTRSVSQIQSPWMPAQGSVITVFVYYSFQPASGLFGSALTINMAASSRYTVE